MQAALHILNLEDNPNDSELIQAALEADGIECEIARVETEQEFIAAVERGGFDLILADYRLPSFDGLSALAFARVKSPDLPFICISGTIGEELAVEMLKNGATDYILKDKLFRLGPAVRRALKEAQERSDRRQAEKALRDTSQLNRQIIESAQEGIIVYGRDLKYQGWNPFMEQLTGLLASEVLGRHPLEIFPFLRETGVLAAIERALKGEVVEPARFRFHIPKTGRSGWTSDISAPLRNTEGEIIGVIGVVRDITEHVRAEDALRQTEEKYRILVEQANDGIIIVQDGIVKYANARMAELDGSSLNELVGTPYTSHIHPSELARLADIYRRRLAGERLPSTYETILLRKNGTPAHAELNAALVMYDGKPADLIIVRDINERKQKQEELGKLTRILRARNRSSRAMMEAENELWYLNEVCRIIVEDCGHTMVWIGFADDNKEKTVRPVAHAGFEEGYLESLHLTWADRDGGRGPVGTAIRTGKPVIIQDTVTDARFVPWREEALRRGYSSVIGVPLLSGGKAFGSLNIYSGRPNSFTEEEAVLLTGLAEDLSYGITAIRARLAQAEAERALWESENRYRSLFENMSEGLAYCRMIFENDLPQDFIYLEVNSSFEKLTGLKDVVGRRVTEVIPGIREADPGLFEKYARVARTGKPESFEMFVEALKMWFSISVYSPEKGFFVAVFDVITERKRAEEALAASEKKYRLLHETMRDAFVSVDMRGRITEFNKAYREMLGYSEEELLKLTYVDITPEKWHSFEAKIVEEQVLARGFSFVYEKEYRRKDNTIFPIELRTVLVKDDSGNPVSMWAIVRDITERKKAEEVLRESEERFRHIFESGPLGMLVAGTDYRILKVNEAFCTMLGFSEDELIGRSIEDITYLEDRGRSREVSLQVLEGVIPRFHLEKRYMKKNGEPVWVNLTATTIHGPTGDVLYALGMVEDITERKEAEETLRKLFAEKEEEAEISRSLVKIVNALNTSLGESELIKSVITLTPNYLKFDRTTIFLYDENLSGFTFAGGYGLTPVEEGTLVSRTFREGDFPAIAKFLKGETILIENTAGSALLTGELVDTFHIGSILMVPITVRGNVIGGMTGGYKDARPIEHRDIALLKGLADGMAIALQNSRLYRESIERLMELSAKIETINAMSQLDKEIFSSIDRSSILRTATALTNRIIPCDRVAVLLKEGDRFRVVSEWGTGHFQDKSYPLKGSHFETFEKNHVSLYLPETSQDDCPYHKEQAAEGIASSLLVPLMTKEGLVGLLDISSIHSGRLTPRDLSTTENIASQIAVALENARLYEELQQLLVSTITSLASAIDAKSPWTKGHSERVTHYAVEIGREMGLKDEELERLKLAGLLHDVGKIGTYDLLLDKPGKFTAEEFEIVKRHPGKGAEILAPIRQLHDVIPGILHHHERYDGRGYPDGLKGEEIPFYGRILCAADSFDAMTADRPYRAAPGKEFAISELKICSGTQFDPKVVEAFLKVLAG